MPIKIALLQFLSTPSARRATKRRAGPKPLDLISIHALREEGDEMPSQIFSFATLFLSTPSARRATAVLSVCLIRQVLFLSTPSARRATARRWIRSAKLSYFYPRPPRGGRLVLPDGWEVDDTYFYPRPPRGGRPSQTSLFHMEGKFLSTPSARRATFRLLVIVGQIAISIHALREEGDTR